MPLQTRILTTKLYRPRITGPLVDRPRLLERLEERRDRPLTLVVAPAGYGKTTLVSSWLESCDCPGAWVSLDQDDDDLMLFLSYLLASIETLFPGIVNETRSLLKATALPPLPVLIQCLVNELDRVGCAFILVLDDYHHIHSIAIHDLIEGLLAHPPRSMHLVLISRKDAPLSLARLRARRQVTEVRTHELRFTQEETAAFIEQETGEPADESVVRSLRQRVEGWVTGMQLLTLSLRHRGRLDLSSTRLRGSVAYVTEYLMAEVMANQPQAIQDCLLSTAILDRFCAPLCEAVCLSSGSSGTGPAELSGQAFVEWLKGSGLFVVPLDDRGEWYRYHQLFRDMLHKRLERELGRDGIAALHSRASEWLARHRLIDEALDHALDAGESETAGELAAKHRHDLINQEQWQHLERWLRLLGRAAIDTSPGLSIAEAWLLNHHAQIELVFDALDRTERLLAQTEPPSEVADPIRGEVHLLRANLLGWLNRAPEALAMIEPASSLLPEQWLYAHAAVSMIYGFGYAQTGKAELAEKTLLAGLNARLVDDSPRDKSLLLYALSTMRWTGLNLQGLKESAARYLDYGQRAGLPETEAVAQHFLGCAHYHLDELREAENHFLAAARNSYVANRSFYVQAVCGLAFTRQALGRPKEARELLETCRNDLFDQLAPLPLGVLQAGQAELALAQDDIGTATGWAKVYDPQPVAGLQMFFIPQVTLAKVHVAQSTAASLNRAEAILLQFVEIARNNHFKSALLYALPLQALLFDIRDDSVAALAALEEAVHLGQSANMVRVFVDLGPSVAGQHSLRLARLLERLGQRGVATDYVARILAAIGTADDGRQAAVQPATGAMATSPATRGLSSPPLDPLTERELQVLTLLAQRLTNKEIASQLVISSGTVAQHTHRIYQKLDVHSRRQAVNQARALQILP